MFVIPRNIKYVLNTLKVNGFDAYLVGGCVRDTLMNITPKDYDITTNALPQQILECFKDSKTLTQGLKHGTVTVIFQGEPVEITTYRIDGEYSDFRHPESVTFSQNVADDLSRRDFTVNAICYNPDVGFCDPFDGENDIKNKFIRCVGEPSLRFTEDALRIMRALRFSSVLDFDIDYKTSLAIHKFAHLLRNISAERIAVEFKKLLCGKRAGEVVKAYRDVFEIILPQCKLLSDCDYEKITNSLENFTQNSSDDILGLSCFFSEFKSAEDIASSLKSLKYSNVIVASVSEICSLVRLEVKRDIVFCKRLVQWLGYENSNKLLEVMLYKEDIDVETYLQLKDMLLKIQQENVCVSISQLAVNGNDLTEIGIPKNKILGEILNELLENVICENIPNTRQILLEQAKEFYYGKRTT